MPLSGYTRFGIGGPADVLIETPDPAEFLSELRAVEGPHLVLGGGTNLLVSDEGYRGTVLRYLGSAIRQDGETLHVQSGAELEEVVSYAASHGLAGIESLMRIPGWVSGAVYGNAGAYGQSIQEVITRVEIFDGHEVRWISNFDCGFSYRTSDFKKKRNWVILAAEFSLRPGSTNELIARAEEIRAIRDAKFPQTMKCAGSIFKNCFFAALPISAQQRVPASVVRDGKVPSAFFLEHVGAKGMTNGGIRVADYHANLIYNGSGGSARQAVELIDDLKSRVAAEFGFQLEEEVQFVGFSSRPSY